ncbi:hypothetical protein CYL77_01350 [Corynebacterium glutamicum]|nr:hypothetical protein B7P23_11650 [Corynebacterium glutamicum]AUH99873.1 hypothetical protein CYL77_01350 [Corynebacterium glutamicum]AUI03512.1 hypothetical protein C0I99_05035 [Corynebacterium glutamicum]
MTKSIGYPGIFDHLVKKGLKTDGCTPSLRNLMGEKRRDSLVPDIRPQKACFFKFLGLMVWSLSNFDFGLGRLYPPEVLLMGFEGLGHTKNHLRKLEA